MLSSLRQNAAFLYFFAVSVATGNVHSFQQQTLGTEARDWFSEGGSSILAVLESQTDDAVSLREASSNQLRVVPISKLGQNDRNYLQAAKFREMDRLQFARVIENLDDLRERPETVPEILNVLSKDYPSSPYADLWGGVAQCAGQNKPELAESRFKESIKRIQKQREVDPSLHLRTLIAVHNNLAVCYVKQTKGDNAVGEFIKAISLMDMIPPTLAHNTRFMNELTTGGKRAAVRVQPEFQSKLVRAIARLPLEDSKKKYQNGWYYSLEMDIPFGEGNDLQVKGIVPPDPTLELIACGTGLVVAPGHVLTTANSIRHASRKPTLATIAAKVSDSPNSGWKLQPARRVIVSIPEKTVTGGKDIKKTVVTETRSNTSSVGLSTGDAGIGLSATQSTSVANISGQVTDFKLEVFEKGSTQAELAVLQIDGLKVKPYLFGDIVASDGDAVLIAGYQRGPNMLDKLLFARGQVVNLDAKTGHLFTSARPAGGVRGGPVFDDSFNIVGVHWDLGKFGGESASLAFTTDEVRNWMGKYVQTADLSIDHALGKTDRQKLLEQAIVPILTWGRRADFEDPTYAAYYQVDNIAQRFVLRDEWCFRCGGDGMKRCTECSGAGEVKVGTQQVPYARNPVTGALMTREEAVLKTCPGCRGNRDVRCPDCKEGRIPGGPNTVANKR